MELMRRVTLGQYVERSSPVHSLDPHVKMLALLCTMAVVFHLTAPLTFLLLGALLLATAGLSDVGLGYYVGGLRPALWLAGMTATFNLLFSRDGTVVFHWHVLWLTDQGVRNAWLVLVRIVALVMATSLLTLTTEPLSLTDGLERLGGPLKRLRVPVHELALMVSISLRFIPTLMEHAERLMKAQMARGADMETGHLVRRVKALVPVLVPLFVQAFKAADDLADAMEARGYRGGAGRTRTFRQLQLRARDAGAAAFWLFLSGSLWWFDPYLA